MAFIMSYDVTNLTRYEHQFLLQAIMKREYLRAYGWEYKMKRNLERNKAVKLRTRFKWIRIGPIAGLWSGNDKASDYGRELPYTGGQVPTSQRRSYYQIISWSHHMLITWCTDCHNTELVLAKAPSHYLSLQFNSFITADSSSKTIITLSWSAEHLRTSAIIYDYIFLISNVRKQMQENKKM